ncbi:putative chitinase [Rhizobium subbaraonis]|uniref:Putative chitinase n=1 Tax=Rhizobium subbaraonis TaxID=908946 RepID=A0A285UIC1_9HYPH|nr:peptidoglycan-binding protein [Rhizobium subbaraonis]SOC41599.1 putative chitinase [Rhizobium subbaraonis]
MSKPLASLIGPAVLRSLAPKPSSTQANSQAAVIAGFGAMLPELLPQSEVTTPLRISHFLSQTAHESDGFCTTVEYASGAAYEGRKDLGNTQPGDGQRYRGRGPIQLTGRDNYRRFTAWLSRRMPGSPNFENNPYIVAEWPWAGWAAAYFWSENGLNALADRDDLVAVTKRINGGKNGLEDRGRYLTKAKALIQPIAATLVERSPGYPVLSRGSKGGEVVDLQRGLSTYGLPIGIDGDFGPATELAVKSFQRASGLVVDGIAGARTFAALAPHLPFERDL